MASWDCSIANDAFQCVDWVTGGYLIVGEECDDVHMAASACFFNDLGKGPSDQEM